MKSPLLHKQENTGESRVESLLSQLREQTQHNPPPALRGRLAELDKQQMEETQTLAERQHKSSRRARRIVLSTAAAIGCVLLAGFLTEILLHKPNSHDRFAHAVVTPHASSVPSSDHQAVMAPVPSLDSVPGAEPASGGQRTDHLIIPLPYSDRAVATGTSSAIPVSVSQTELLALGVPVEPSADDQRFVAELILGSDGLPRALSVPLPLAPVEDMQ